MHSDSGKENRSACTTCRSLVVACAALVLFLTFSYWQKLALVALVDTETYRITQRPSNSSAIGSSAKLKSDHDLSRNSSSFAIRSSADLQSDDKMPQPSNTSVMPSSVNLPSQHKLPVSSSTSVMPSVVNIEVNQSTQQSGKSSGMRSSAKPKPRPSTPQTWAACIAAKERPWLMLAGDSNWRGVYWRLLERLDAIGLRKLASVTIETPGRKAAKPGENCDPRWFDQDVLYEMGAHDGRREFRISLRFMTSVEARIQTLSQNWSTLRHCCLPSANFCDGPAYIRKGMGAFYDKRWTVPYGLVFTHGLWSLPTPKSNQANTLPMQNYCDAYQPLQRTALSFKHMFEGKARHDAIVSQLVNWSSLLDSPRIEFLRWATNFPIRSHPTIRLNHVEHDVACQRAAAQHAGVALIDTWRHVERAGVTKHVGDFHFDTVVADSILDDLFMQMDC